MKKFLSIILVMLCLSMMFTGCQKLKEEDKAETKKDDSDKKEKKKDKKDKKEKEKEDPVEFSDNILISFTYGGAGYGDAADCMGAVVYVYTDAHVETEFNNEIIDSCELFSYEYEEAQKAVNLKRLYKMKIEEDMETCDGDSTYFQLYDKNDQLLKSVGGYMVKNDEYWEMRSALMAALPMERISNEIYKAKEEFRLELYGEEYGDGTGDGDDELYSYKIFNPDWERFINPDRIIEGEEYGIFHSLTVIEQTPNDITDDYEWFEDNVLSRPLDECNDILSVDGTYLIELEGDYPYRTLEIYEITPDGFVDYAEVDISNYVNPEALDPDWPFVEEGIRYAQIVGDVLYVEISHNTYSASAPTTAYIAALAMDDFELLWLSEPLTANADCFAIVDDTIFTGYGFTDEPDYVYGINRFTGEIMDTYPVKTGPDYLIYKDGMLYVRTYDMNYLYQID